jgi:membrane protease YdiL (CAAX protease family)
MNTSTPPKRSTLIFFISVFALSIPFWLIGALAERGLPVPMNLPVSALSFVCPTIAALFLVYRENKVDGIKELLKRTFNYKKIKKKIWYLPIFFLLPIIYLLSYEIMRLIGKPLPEPHIQFLMIPVLFVGFFIAGACEELGWVGYAVDPMQDQWSALKTGVILGLVWGIWHFIPDIQAHHSLTWIAWQRGIRAVALRILFVWLYNNTGKSVFAAILFHDTDNVSWSLFPNNGSHYDPAINGMLIAIAAVVVIFLWGYKTLARYRYADQDLKPT